MTNDDQLVTVWSSAIAHCLYRIHSLQGGNPANQPGSERETVITLCL